MESLADMSAAWTAVRMPGSFPWLLFFLQGMREKEALALSTELDKDLDRVKLIEMGNSCWNFDLTRARSNVTVPTLYLEQRMPNHAELRDSFLRFLPHAEVQQLASWPTPLQDEECGRNLSRNAIEFIRRQSSESPCRD
jgi:hypothetical protein